MAKELKAAYESYLSAIECAKKVFVSDQYQSKQQLAVVMNDCATVLVDMGELEKAEKVIHEALEIMQEDAEEKDASGYHENMAVFLMNLAAVQERQGDTLNAIKTYTSSFQHAVKISNKFLLTNINKSINSLKKNL